MKRCEDGAGLKKVLKYRWLSEKEFKLEEFWTAGTAEGVVMQTRRALTYIYIPASKRRLRNRHC